MKAILLIVLALFVTGCATGPSQDAVDQHNQMLAAHYQMGAAAVQHCKTDLCVKVVIDGMAQSAPRVPQKQYHPAWQLLDRTLSLALPIYGSYLQGRQWADAMVGVVNTVGGMDRSFTDNSVNVGRDQIGGDRVIDNSDNSDSSTSVGGDYAGRDMYSESCIGDDCRYGSPGPIDQSETDNSNTDNSNNSDNSTENPAADAED